MWNEFARSGGRVVFSKLGSSSSLASCRLLATSASPLGEGGLEFRTQRYPSFWSRLKQQKHGLGNMALSASIVFLGVSIIKQEKELTSANETASRLRQQNEALNERLEDLKSVLVRPDKGETPERAIVALLREVLDVNGGGHPAPALLDSPDQTDNPLQSSSRSKFMV